MQTWFRFRGGFGFTCSFEFDDSDVGDFANTDVKDKILM